MGNEIGTGKPFIDSYNWLKKMDDTRLVSYDRTKVDPEFNHIRHTDIIGYMYAPIVDVEKEHLPMSPNRPFIWVEYAHSMGNSTGNLKELWNFFRREPRVQGGFIWDWIDQGITINNKKGEELGYGGDFGPAGKPHAGAFCLNGLIFPDRTIQPALWEVKKQYQSIHLKMMDVTALTFEVYNENFFINLSEYDLEWEVLENEYRTDVRWLELKNKENQVFRFYSKQYLNFNVNHFNNEDFEPNGKNRHNTDIVTRKHTNLNVDYKQMGVGGDTSWGALPYQQYLIYPEPMKYTFIIEPLFNK